MTTITIPRETFDAMREALEIAEKHLAYVEIFEALSAAKVIVADKSAPREDNIE